jgi:hypothetical protein
MKNEELELLQKYMEIEVFIRERDRTAQAQNEKRRLEEFERNKFGHDGRPIDSGAMLDALRREHGHDCPDGLRRDIWRPSKK